MICREGTYKTCQTIYASLSVALALAAFAIHWTDSTFNHVYEICFSRAAQTELEWVWELIEGTKTECEALIQSLRSNRPDVFCKKAVLKNFA